MIQSKILATKEGIKYNGLTPDPENMAICWLDYTPTRIEVFLELKSEIEKRSERLGLLPRWIKTTNLKFLFDFLHFTNPMHWWFNFDKNWPC